MVCSRPGWATHRCTGGHQLHHGIQRQQLANVASQDEQPGAAQPLAGLQVRLLLDSQRVEQQRLVLKEGGQNPAKVIDEVCLSLQVALHQHSL